MKPGLKTRCVSLSTSSKQIRAANTSLRSRRCNLCVDEFQPKSEFERYCPTCKEESELLKFSEWLPELDAAITERLSA